MSISVSDSERTYIRVQVCVKMVEVYAVGPGYNDIGLYDTFSIASNTLRYQLIPHCEPYVILLGYNNTRL